MPGAGSTEDEARALCHDGLLTPLQGAGPVQQPGQQPGLLPYDHGLMETFG